MGVLYFVTGSSGSGKTTLLKKIVKEIYPDLRVYHSDELGVPSNKEMNEKFGGPEQWQAYNIQQWVEKIIFNKSESLTVLDSQARPTIVLNAAKNAGLAALHITLIDCSHEERRKRLVEDRKQPELDNLDMYAWSAYLRGQADAMKLEIIDTSSLSVEEATHLLASSIDLFAKENGILLNRRNK